MRANVLGFILCGFLATHAAQAQQACEPAESPRCRFITHCLKPAPPPKKGPGVRPLTQENCSCVWNLIARAFPAEEHALLAAYWEAATAREGSQEKVRALFPDKAKQQELVRKILQQIYSANPRECPP